MFQSIRQRLQAYLMQKQISPELNGQTTQLKPELMENLIKIRQDFQGTSDLVIREMQLGRISAALVCMEGMINIQAIAQGVLNPLLKGDYSSCDTPQQQFAAVRDSLVALSEQSEISNYEELYGLIMSGFAVILLQGCPHGLAIGVQGFNFRSVSEPATETMQRGSREGFVEVLRINVSMIRRRMKTTDLQFEMLKVGSKSQTDVCLCYMKSVVSRDILQNVRAKLQAVPLETVLETGYLQPYLDDKPFSLFSGVGVCERPDTLCGKIAEGRIGVLVDGTPMVLIVPYLFVENFQSFDDYADRPYFATFTRWLKYISFFIATLLPGLFVAIGTYHLELFPTPMLYNLAVAESSQPFSLMVEALVIHFIYELMREAGLRLPKPIGHVVGIIGGLVIGDAAVKAGIISSPMIMVVALTAISSFVIPQLYEPMTILRFLFIVVGGTTYLMGLMLVFAAVVVNLCSINPYGIPYSAPLSPFRGKSLRDVLIRSNWKKLGKKNIKIQNMPGSDKMEP